MTDFTQKARKYCVTVDGGSGVLIQPMTGDNSYVVTAKHVIETEDGSNIFRNYDEISVLDYERNSIDIVAVHTHDVLDLAVLITKNRLDIELHPAISSLSRNEKILFYGYAETRRNKNPEDYLREYEGEVKESDTNRFIVRLEEKPNWEEVAGASGGGIFTVIVDEMFLSGIETRMEGDIDSEYHGRVVCLPICSLETFLVQKELPLIYPSAMNSFISLVSKTFGYYDQADDPQNLHFLKNNLHAYANNLSANTTVKPLDLFKKFERALLVSNSPLQDLYCADLWIAYLEFIVISCLIDEAETLDFAYIENNCTKRKFLFSSNKENWVWQLMHIFRSDFRGLARGGAIVISSGDRTGTLAAKSQLIDRVVVDIGRTAREKLMVDTAIVNPAREFKVYHLTGLHKVCVLDKEYDLANYYAGNDGFDVIEMIEKIRGEYRAYIYIRRKCGIPVQPVSDGTFFLFSLSS